jgi:type VI secretion system secreted protein Hcp
MAVDLFLVIPPVSGNPPVSADPVQDQYFKTTFQTAAVAEIRQFSLGEENPTTIGSTTTGAGAGKAMFKELVVEKAVDKLSRSLFTISVTGGHLRRMQLYVRKVGGAPTAGAKPYLVYGFDTVLVSEIDWSGSLGDEEPLERVTFAYGALAFGYYPQRPDGTFDTAVKTSWSQVMNSAPPPDPVLAGF